MDPGLDERSALNGNVRPAAKKKRLHADARIGVQMPEAECRRSLRRHGHAHAGSRYPVKCVKADIGIEAVGMKGRAEHIEMLGLITRTNLNPPVVRLEDERIGLPVSTWKSKAENQTAEQTA